MAFRRMGLMGGLGLAAGLGLVAFVFAGTDWDVLRQSLSVVGAEFVVICLFRFLPIGFDAMGWRSLHRPALAGPFFMTRTRWIGESVNTLLPVGQVGGDVVRARLLGKSSANMTSAAASTAADFALGLVAQAAFTIAALVLFFAALGVSALAGQAMIGGGITVLIGIIVVCLVRGGVLSRLVSLARGALPETWAARTTEAAAAADATIKEIMNDRRAVAQCFVWRFAGWFVRAGEPWLILWLAGLPVSIFAALVVEAVANAARSAAFFVPGAIGVQEGGIMAVSLALGMDMETAALLAVVKRGREVAVSLPGLIDWWWQERRFRRLSESSS